MSRISKLNISLVFVICLLCAFICCGASADEADTPVSYTETPIYIDGMLSCRGYVINDTTYLPLESSCAVLGYDFTADYDTETKTLTVKVEDIEITVCEDDKYLSANDRYFYLPDGYIEIDGSAVVPIETVAKLFTLDLKLDKQLNAYNLDTANMALLVNGEDFYDAEDLYWMSRIITYEAGNQCIEGQIGVGNVVMNRVESKGFRSTVKGVIFQSGQFAPVASGAIYMDPFEFSTICAKMVFEGANTVGDSLYFQIGRGNDLISRTKTFVIKIDDHNFFM